MVNPGFRSRKFRFIFVLLITHNQSDLRAMTSISIYRIEIIKLNRSPIIMIDSSFF